MRAFPGSFGGSLIGIDSRVVCYVSVSSGLFHCVKEVKKVNTGPLQYT